MTNEREELRLQGSPTAPIGPKIEKAIFISYANTGKENEYLVEAILRGFLEILGLNVYTYKDARSSKPIIEEIRRFIRECPNCLAIFTKDIEQKTEQIGNEIWHPKLNIADELGGALALCHTVIIYREEGVTIPSNTASYFCRKFKNSPEKYAELLIDLLKALKNEGIFP